jgi:large subunit ribosomal protein L15
LKRCNLKRIHFEKRKIRIGSLTPAPGAGKKRKRVGRGPGSGHGKTSTRGHKGQLARSGAKRRAWSEGGQMPLQRRLPKRGFTNIFKKQYQIVNISDLSRISGTDEISPQTMREIGLIKKVHVPVKILGQGNFQAAVKVLAHAFSKKAQEKILAAGGKTEVIKC